ncbi:MAG: DEAD/DEAH box helicase family protein [Actinobacteria bacterium]|nr:DEAD/DEAH box helicase family protein [Actinomycetota bacterium]
MTILRQWQERALERLAEWDQGSFLLSAAPGAGKTIPSLAFARTLLDAGIVTRVHVVCPTTPLTRQWAEVAGRFGIQLAPDSEELHPPRDFHGIAATYARVASSAARWAPQCGPRTLIVADEAHHLGDELAWGEGFARAFAATPRWLLLSGTPFRSDGTAIAGVRYDAGGMCIPDVSYTYADAVRDGICRPVVFVPYDGVLSWQSGDEVIESSFADSEVTGREASRRYRTAISTELSDGLPRILHAADERLGDIRSTGGHRDAGGLVVTADGGHARRVAAVLKEITGRSPVVVVHTDARAAAKLRAFGEGRERWIVAVNMVSEGVDIPRLRVGVYATAAKTPLMFRQIVGRFVRTLAGRPAEHSYLFLPADRLLRAHAAEVETELRHVLRAPPEDDGLGLLDEPPARRESEPTEPEAFLALNADVAPQLALFSGGPPPPRVTPSPPKPAVDAAASSPAVAEEPVFQRRRRLRDKRTGLVRALAGMEGRTYREINSWLNRQTKVDSVEAATVEQLERAIELLQGELDRIGRRRARRAS